MNQRIQTFGWRPQKPDHRDLYFGLSEEILTAAQLPAAGGRTPDTLPPVWNQGQIGSCVGHGSLLAFLAEATQQSLSLPMLSRLFVYAKGRELEGVPLDQDSGMEVRDALKVLATLGVPPETDWPYSDANPGPFQQEPPALAIHDALANRALKYQQILVGGPGAPMRTALHRGLVIVDGFTVPDYFEDGTWDPASGEPLPLPGPNTQFIGGHCTGTYAYNFGGKFVSTPSTNRSVQPYFTKRNSWDSSFGMNGDFNIDARWYDPSRQLAADLWVTQLVS